jgi:16S rRNA (guanine(966)-N(2))-methyltransferase RsmD
MSVRIIAGKLGSRVIECPGDIRPTADRVKEAMFSALGIDLSGLSVLDLFAGSGALGFEALSRGAKSVVFVDNSLSSIRFIKKNASMLDITQACIVEYSDVMEFIRKSSTEYDLVLADPPYNKGLASKTAAELYRLIKPAGMAVIEHSHKEPAEVDAFKQKKYGDTMLSFIKRSIT